MELDILFYNAHHAIKSDSDAAHDYWLTRNGHGCGFGDGDWPEPQATKLDLASRAVGEYHLYLGHDGKVYGENNDARLLL
jgi:hypothetical protein